MKTVMKIDTKICASDRERIRELEQRINGVADHLSMVLENTDFVDDPELRERLENMLAELLPELSPAPKLGPETLHKMAAAVAENWGEQDTVVIDARLCASAWEAERAEFEWLFTHEPPDHLGLFSQTLREIWCARRDILLANIVPNAPIPTEDDD